MTWFAKRSASSQGMDRLNDEVQLKAGDDGQTDSGGETEVDPMAFPLLPPELIMLIVDMAVHADLRAVLAGVTHVQGKL